jgi:hypothetical protein
MAQQIPLSSVTMSMAFLGKLLAQYYTLPSGVQIDSITADETGDWATVVFAGSGLGSWAIPPPVAGEILVNPDMSIEIAAVGTSSSSGQSSGG